MENGRWYVLDPASIIIHRKSFYLVRCLFQNPSRPNEYVVCGIPAGENKEESFVLNFTDGGVRVTPTGPPALIAPPASG